MSHIYRTLFPNLPDDARFWCYVADRPLFAEEQSQLLGHLDTFFASWQSHGRPVTGAAQIVGGRLLLVAATLEGEISGCGIDASVHAVTDIGAALGVTWKTGLFVVYRDAEGHVCVAPRRAFKQAVQAGDVSPETPVLDLTLLHLGDVRAGRFEQPAAESWVSRIVRFGTVAA
ncbi:MAG: hypothetical protein RhofKO_09940 [Rhodothermales bacterium]